ncbi:MAG: hypothetical protein QNJ84_18735 [Alphaproteobacteria bacterium]|nr:hypothetical protein [Alphaproteobacteria bacterium]
MTATVDIRQGAIYLSRETYQTYFAGIEAVIVLIRDRTLQVLPVMHMAAGGCLLKMRNAAGDRVASAPDVFAANGLFDWTATEIEGRWSAEAGGLVIALPD